MHTAPIALVAGLAVFSIGEPALRIYTGQQTARFSPFPSTAVAPPPHFNVTSAPTPAACPELYAAMDKLWIPADFTTNASAWLVLTDRARRLPDALRTTASIADVTRAFFDVHTAGDELWYSHLVAMPDLLRGAQEVRWDDGGWWPFSRGVGRRGLVFEGAFKWWRHWQSRWLEEAEDVRQRALSLSFL